MTARRFTADDIVFSLNRANGPGSNMQGNFVSVKEIKKVDDLRVDVTTKYPDPLLADKWSALGMMSKAWAEKNNAVNAADMTKNEENFATRNAKGTGPFMLKERRPTRRRSWSPTRTGGTSPTHNLTEVIFTPIANAATRVAALMSGDIDMIYDGAAGRTPSRSKKDANIKVMEGPETRDRSSSAWTRSATSCSNPTSRARTRSRTSACARPSTADRRRRDQAHGDARPVAPDRPDGRRRASTATRRTSTSGRRC